METREDYTGQTFHFPQEILLEILVRLPAKSIFRCKCVSRIWLSLISDPLFFRHFISRSYDSPPFAIIFQCGKSIEMRRFEYAQNTSTDLCREICFDRVPGLKVDATSNDLILQHRSDSQEPVYSITNPFTGQSVTLPMHSSKKCFSSGLVSYIGNGITTFNVVRIVEDSNNSSFTTQHCLNLETFSSQTGEWTNFEVRNLASNIEFDSRPSIVFKGTLHWICNKMTALLAYDPRSCSPDGCRLIRVPNQAYYMNGTNAILGVSGGNLCYFEMNGICIHDRKFPGWKLRRMREYENGEWSLERKGNEKEIVSLSVVSIVLSRHSPVFPVAFHPWNEGIVYFWCEDYVLRFDAKKGWFDDEIFGLDCGRMDSMVEIFPLLMPFCGTQLSHS